MSIYNRQRRAGGREECYWCQLPGTCSETLVRVVRWLPGRQQARVVEAWQDGDTTEYVVSHEALKG